MKKYLAFSILLPALIIFCMAAECPCGNRGTAHHKRFPVKERSIGNSGDAMKYTFTKLCKLKITDAQIKNVRDDETLVLPNEKKIVKITGYLRLLKESADDCDLHMEIATKKADGAYRFIAEIPNTDEYCDLRKQVYDVLKSKYNLNKRKEYDFGTGSIDVLPKITVTGLVFFDNAHISHDDPDAGHNHGSALVQTLWEIHPVFKVEWL
jgi:hypothetical protein